MIVVDASLWVSAFDPTDALHAPAREFLRRCQRRVEPLVIPSFAVIETGCALARRFAAPERGQEAAERLLAFPLLQVMPVDAALERAALRLGTRCRLRAADSLYAALALQLGVPLVTTDLELIERASQHIRVLPPTDWPGKG